MHVAKVATRFHATHHACIQNSLEMKVERTV